METHTSVNTVKSVATAVSTSRMAPKMIPLLLKAKGSERTPPPARGSTRNVYIRQMAERGGDEAATVHRKYCVNGEWERQEGAEKLLAMPT